MIAVQTKGLLTAAIAVGLGFGAMRLEKAIFFKTAPAIVTSVTYDCDIQQHRTKFFEFLTRAGKDTMVYMSCNRAKKIARRKGYSSYAVKRRTKIAYRDVSPANNVSYSGPFILNIIRNANDSRGKKITVYASNSKPEKSVYYHWEF
jgi:hypothetical protein